jgi:D-alanyl-lipoteichoic acid acyltransferase DltB (MBOAT superfamily)
VLLLAASYIFYGYVHPWLLILIGAYTLITYACGIGIERLSSFRTHFLWASVLSSVGVLVVFKYFGFFIQNLNAFLSMIGFPTTLNTFSIFLPIGISFYTFQALSYTVDVYRGEISARYDLTDFALFISFFPQLVAGPIERAGNLLQQFERRRTLNASDAYSAITLLVWGFFKKLVIADNVAVMVDKIFLLQEKSFILLWVGVFGFAIQILADFSAYTDIARGAARILGIQLVQNFNHPYFSLNPTEFWRRWHMSLSRWFRDYLYIPLGGSRVGSFRATANLYITFFVTGLWHGASWNFVLWGIYHAFLIHADRLVRGSRLSRLLSGSVWHSASTMATFILVCIGWLIFRETNLSILIEDLSLSPLHMPPGHAKAALLLFSEMLIYSLPIWAHGLLAPILQNWEHKVKGARFALLLAKTCTSAILLILILLIRADDPSAFIYFQF